MLVWAVHDGGYDAETWYWGGLASLGVLAMTAVVLRQRLRLTRPRLVTIALLAGYVGWCYASIAWAQSPGDALQGANQALLYLLVFALCVLLPWTAEAALTALAAFAAGIGVIGIVLLFDLASSHHVAGLVIEGRLAAPTGYFNATAALFTIDALVSIGLATRRELPGPVRGLMLSFACSGLALAVTVQSRGWLFTLPIVFLIAAITVRDRLRVALAAVIPLAGTFAVLGRLLDVYRSSGAAALTHAAAAAARPTLMICAAAFVIGTLLAWADSLWPTAPLSPRRRRLVGSVVIAAVLIALAGGGLRATHGDPIGFISRQWNGFSHQQTSSSGSHFADVGSGRYDFWRVALDAFVANPVGGLGEDNFADYYVRRRRTLEEPSWTHSIELRLLAQTGLVGFALMTAFLLSALRLAVRARSGPGPLAPAVAAIALMPLIVWLVHGSVDWFWEMPALSGPALGFLGVAGSLEPAGAPAAAVESADRRQPGSGGRPAINPSGVLGVAAGVLAVAAGVLALGLPYLSVREVSLASDVSSSSPAAALSDLATAASLNPLSSVPGRLAGAIALREGRYGVAQMRFQQSIAREPGGWFAWLGAGLAASALAERGRARADFAAAYAINSNQPAIRQALARVYSRRPLSAAEAFSLLVIVQ